MKIKYGTRLTSYYACRAFLLGCLVCFTGTFNIFLQQSFGKSEKSILQSRNITVTERRIIFYCDLPYDDCLCSVLSNKSDTSDNCITYAVLVGSRVLPMVSFFLQIVFVRELFSFSADTPRAVIYSSWITSIFAFIGMTISIYLNSCYHVCVTLILSITGTLLWMLSMYNALVVRDYEAASFNSNQIVVVQKSKKDNKGDKSWQELI